MGTLCLCVSCVYAFALWTVTAGPAAAGGHAEPSDRSVHNIPRSIVGVLGLTMVFEAQINNKDFFYLL